MTTNNNYLIGKPMNLNIINNDIVSPPQIPVLSQKILVNQGLNLMPIFPNIGTGIKIPSISGVPPSIPKSYARPAVECAQSSIKTHVAPIYIPAPTYTIGVKKSVDPEIKLEHQRKINREKQLRYKEKTKPFVKLGKLPTIHERIKYLLIITYPDVFSDENLDLLDKLVDDFVQNSFRLALTPNFH